MSHARAPTAIVVSALACQLGACAEPLPPLSYETQHAVIGTDFGDPLCGYDLAAIDEQVEFAQGMLDASSEDKVEIYLYDRTPDFCGGGAVTGCYNPEQDIVVTMWSAVDHEIVHAVVDRFASPPPFWSEGIAEALRLHRPTIRGYVPIEENAASGKTREVDRFGAGHFVRWALDEHSPEALKQVLQGEPVDQILGAPIETIAARYEAEAPEAYPGFSPCDYPSLHQTSPGHWSEAVEVSCDSADVTRFSERSWTLLRSVELEGGEYEFLVEGTDAWGQLLGCLTEPLLEPVQPMMHGSTMSELEHSLTAPGVRFEAGTTHTIELTQGLYKLAVPVDDDGQRVEVSLTRVAGG